MMRFQLPALLISTFIALFGLTGCGGDSGQTPEQANIATENLAKGKAFMEANKDKEGIISLDSGIQYRVISEGDEESRRPKLADSVKIHYRSFHIDGSELYNTRNEAEPQTVEVKHAILGWRKVLPLMNIGSKWMVYVPSYLAYSSKGYKDTIAPHETLIFEIELMEIVW
ncbi:outer membrane protein MIP precursor [Mariprofundus micogutta]|uniref:Peptidyl-prolyl cis-trans isomerase n=1 Tax=Mariprofundus micogutta TaxID=1921010 RepID=A0A1L8CKT9_9PROT|nr:FKBP-type peptidyl-prolyl cis-trans isomerase [Mariprofundus micogutta]GAV19520.1 outer membrane protein MIP precursor [Mariprofundus micogutta]